MSVLAHTGSKNHYSTHTSLRAACLKGERETAAALPFGLVLLADDPSDQPTPDEVGAEDAGADDTLAADGGDSGCEAGLCDAVAGVPRPRIAYVNHKSGPASGGTSVTILGNHFTGVTDVLFGDVPAASFQVVSGNRIVAVAPPGEAGVVDLAVAAAGGTSAAVKADRFTYIAAPVITLLKADHGPIRGGTLVIVEGGNFVAGQTKVYFGKRHGKDVKVLSDRLLVVKTPESPVGTVLVAVTTNDGISNEMPFAFA
jgi:hypothetical protein